MLAPVDHDDRDAGPRRSGPDRLCIATRSVRPVAELVRFVVGPDGVVVPDIRRKLPGRGVWVTASRAALETAIVRKAFGRSFKREVRLPSDLVGQTDRLVERAALDALAMTHKAGQVVAGYAKVDAAVSGKPVVGLIHAADARPEGVRRLNAALRRRFGDEKGVPATIDLFTSAQLDLALGRSNVVHAALLAGPASNGFLARCRDLERFRANTPSAGQGAARGGERSAL